MNKYQQLDKKACLDGVHLEFNSTHSAMSLKRDLQKRIIQDMILEARKTDDLLGLVVDEYTSRILSSCCRMYELMENGVLVLQRLDLEREKLDFAAVYFISPDRASIDRVSDDFKDAKKPRYTSVHLFFTSRISNEVMDVIKRSPHLIPRIKTLTELNVDFCATESRVFSLERPKHVQTRVIPSLYFHNKPDLEFELERTAEQLTTLCLTLEQFPYIRFAASSREQLSERLAKLVEKKLKAAVDRLKDWKYKEDRATLLILDRTLDPVAPLMHEYTYQAMIHDLLPVKGELIELEPEEKEREDLDRLRDEEREAKRLERTQVLSEEDELYVELRHLHIAQVMKNVGAQFKAFKQSNKMVAVQGAQ